MGKINLGSVVLGGLVAGVVLNIVDYLVFAVVLKLPVTSGQLIWFVILDFVYGIGLVWVRSEEHTSELQSPYDLVCRLLLEKKNIGMSSKCVVTGDITQIDLPANKRSGVLEAFHALKDVPGIATVYFTDHAVVRHDMVLAIL